MNLDSSGLFLSDEDVAELETSPGGRKKASLLRGVLLGAAVALYTVYSLFGMFAPFWWGHHGYHGAIYLMRARMSLRQHMLLPATWGGFEAPPKSALYLHHPIGYHHIYTLLIPLVGDHEWLARAGGAAGGLLALYVLYVCVKRFWNGWAAVLAVWIYVTLPVLVTFSVLCDPMLIEFVCVLWAVVAYLEYRNSGQTRWLLHTALAFAIGGVMMWEVFFLAPWIFFHAIFAWMGRRQTEQTPKRSLWLYFFCVGLVCTADMAFHIGATYWSGVWDEFLQSYRERHGAGSWSFVIDRHREWLRILYGTAPVFVGFVWLAVALVRRLFDRARQTDFIILTFFYLNTLYIFLFAEGSSVHLYRVFFYSGFFTLALVDLCADGVRASRALRAAFEGFRWDRVGLAVLTICVGIYWGNVLPHSYQTLLESRATMGTHQPRGYSPERQKMSFASEVHRRTSLEDRVIIHYGHLGARKEFWYYIDRNFDEITHLSQLDRYKKTLGRSVLLLDETRIDASERDLFRKLMAEHPVTFFDQFTMVDLRKPAPLVNSYTFVDGPMSPGYRFWVSHVYPPLTLVPRSYLQGECRALEIARPIPIEPGEEIVRPRQANLLPCYHNLLVARGDDSQASEVFESLIAGLRQMDEKLGAVRPSAIGFSGSRLRVLYQSSAPEQAELRYVLRRPKAVPMVLNSSPTLPPLTTWRDGFVYIDEIAVPPQLSKFSVDAELVRRFSPTNFHPPMEWSKEEVVARVELGSFVK